MNFTISARDNGSNARAGIISTAHGDIETPIFMPVGTLGTVKGVHQRELEKDINAQIILGNTYHLYLRPGCDILLKAGGLHRFMNWNRPILTDSGGFQVYSLTDRRKFTADGVKFYSHIDGSKHLFTPENNVDTQRIIGADIVMALDECTPWPCDEKYAASSLKMTHKWLERGIRRFQETEPVYGYPQTFFPIVQGSTFRHLRTASAEFIASLDCEGNAIGGLSVGEPAEMMYEMTALVCGILPATKPRYLMGVGTPVNILENIALGVDMFDCVMPTRNARNGMLFTSEGIINIKNEKWKDDFSVIDIMNHAFTDMAYSKAYLRHLFTVNERLAGQIASIHNLAFYLWLVREARKRIMSGEFAEWKNLMIKKLSLRL